MALKLLNRVAEFLEQNPEQKFSAREIAGWILENYPDECRQKQERSTARLVPLDNDKALITQIVSEIGSGRPQLQRNRPEIKTTEDRPRKYYFTQATDSAQIDHAEDNTARLDGKGTLFREHDLYLVLADFLESELQIYSKRIDEKRSSNSRGAGGNRWLYPDIVGLEDLSSEWNREIKDCVWQYKDKRAKLWSFEVKILLNRANVREAFFQALSNSSWANFGYLVASEIEGSSTLKELRMLSSLHGIGFILLNAENPSESQIMLPAKERTEVDWDTANRLTEENTDFLNYIKQIRKFYQTGEIQPRDWEMRANNG